MSESLAGLLDRLIAESSGIKPEQVTSDFIQRMRKRMYRDLQFQFDESDEYSIDPKTNVLDFQEREKWNQKIRTWSQEVLQEIETETKPRAT